MAKWLNLYSRTVYNGIRGDKKKWTRVWLSISACRVAINKQLGSVESPGHLQESGICWVFVGWKLKEIFKEMKKNITAKVIIDFQDKKYNLNQIKTTRPKWDLHSPTIYQINRNSIRILLGVSDLRWTPFWNEKICFYSNHLFVFTFFLHLFIKMWASLKWIISAAQADI